MQKLERGVKGYLSNPCTPKRNGDAGGGFAEQSA